MSEHQITIKGELFLSLETYADIYCVEVPWLREVYEHGLLGPGVASGPLVCVAAVHMDRVATIVRLNQNLGMDVMDIRIELGVIGVGSLDSM